MRRLVLGLGNDLLGDDGIGPLVVDLLRRRPALRGFDFETAESAGLALLDLVSGYDEAIIVDCVSAPGRPVGEVRCVSPDDLVLESFPRSSHYLGLPEVIELAHRLGLPMPALEVVAISVRDPYRVGQSLTAAMRRALPGIVVQVERILVERVLMEEACA